MSVPWRPLVRHVARVWPVVVTGKISTLVVAELVGILGILIAILSEGASPSSVIKIILVYPSMLVIALTGASVVAPLREDGDLEIALTMPSPERLLLFRFAPISVLAAGQVLFTAVLCAFIISLEQVIIGVAFAILPMVFALSTSFYCNLKWRRPGNVLVASLVIWFIAISWIAPSQIVREAENMQSLSTWEVFWSALRCQLVLVFAAVIMILLSSRRLQSGEEMLDDK